MRMWMLNPRFLCRAHLLGEHNELHKHRPTFEKQHSIAGRIGQIEPQAMKQRHDQLAKEMLRRGYNHKSPYELPDLSYLPSEHKNMKVDPNTAEQELMQRCTECAARLTVGKTHEK